MSKQHEQIETQSEYRKALQVMSAAKRSPWILRALMGAIERYRQGRKMGWSRSQNKVGLQVFRSFKLDPRQEAELVAAALACLDQAFPSLPRAERDFVSELCADPGLMFFVFVHDLEEEGRRFEGVTLSFGRRVKNANRFRDRFDLILDVPVVGDVAAGLGRVRAYVDPFRTPIAEHPPARHDCVSPPILAQQLLQIVAQRYPRLCREPGYAWSHWSHQFIDYFGARVAEPRETWFAEEEPLRRAG
jgi:hypothetical protein